MAAQLPQTREELEAPMKKGHELTLADQAAEHTDLALGALVKLAKRQGAKNDKPPHSVVRGAANDLLEWGHGRAATQTGADKDAGKLTVIVEQLIIQSGQSEEIVIEGEVVRSELQESAEAELVPIEGAAVVEVPD